MTYSRTTLLGVESFVINGHTQHWSSIHYLLRHAAVEESKRICYNAAIASQPFPTFDDHTSSRSILRAAAGSRAGSIRVTCNEEYVHFIHHRSSSWASPNVANVLSGHSPRLA